MRTIFLLLGLTACAIAAEPTAPSLAPPSGSRSPLLLPAPPNASGTEGVWIPGSYGGVTGILLDLDRIGSDQLLQVRFKTGADFKPWPGTGRYRKHSDQTTHDEKKGTTERVVILIDDSAREQTRVKDILCYKILQREKRVSDTGQLVQAEQTHYSATFTPIRDEFEVLFLIRFDHSLNFPPSPAETHDEGTK